MADGMQTSLRDNYGYGTFGLKQKCPHKNFESEVIIGPRIANPDKRCATLRVRCSDCGTHFRFDGLTTGVFGGDTPSAFPHMGFSVILPIEELTPSACRIIDETSPFEKDAKQDA